MSWSHTLCRRKKNRVFHLSYHGVPSGGTYTVKGYRCLHHNRRVFLAIDHWTFSKDIYPVVNYAPVFQTCIHSSSLYRQVDVTCDVIFFSWPVWRHVADAEEFKKRALQQCQVITDIIESAVTTEKISIEIDFFYAVMESEVSLKIKVGPS